MRHQDPHSKALAAHAILKRKMRQEYPAEQYIAIKWGRIVADAASLDELEQELASKQGLRFGEIVVEQAGYDREIVGEYPGMIMMEAIYGLWNEYVTPPSEK